MTGGGEMYEVVREKTRVRGKEWSGEGGSGKERGGEGVVEREENGTRRYRETGSGRKRCEGGGVK